MDQPDSETTNSSIDENTENFCDYPTRDTLSEGLMGIFKPAIDQLEERVQATKASQVALKTQIEEVSNEVTKILANRKPPLELDDYLKKLMNTKNKITVVTNVLQATQERLNKIHASIEKETVRRESLLNTSINTPSTSGTQANLI
ncbi:SNAPIN protein homolog [Ctenocephalides felis]|uniref:SNAPIN protein homolog n=1 Tax=Ctenocephalides felis TaxID=7515 RepID=UPI000E6E41D8|nr:SNAPIN protein homolog [Ctenocephalides felis]